MRTGVVLLVGFTVGVMFMSMLGAANRAEMTAPARVEKHAAEKSCRDCETSCPTPKPCPKCSKSKSTCPPCTQKPCPKAESKEDKPTDSAPATRSRYGSISDAQVAEENQALESGNHASMQYSEDTDIIMRIMKRFGKEYKRIVEFNGGSGSRVGTMCAKWNCELAVNVDPSKKALELSKAKYSNVQIVEGTPDDMAPYDAGWKGTFHAVISYNVLDRVDRSRLWASIQGMHDLLGEQQHLILFSRDMFNNCAERRPAEYGYESYLVDYADMLEKSGLYRNLLDQRVDASNGNQYMEGRTDPIKNIARIVVLQKLSAGELANNPWN